MDPEVTTDEDESQALAELKGKKPLTRQECMELASEMIRIAHGRATSKRFKTQARDAPRLQWARVSVPLLEAYVRLLKEAEIEELAERVRALETGKILMRCRE